MNKDRFKIILIVFISPLIIAVAAGSAYFSMQMIRGKEFRAALESLLSLVDSIIPYLSYITTVPALIVLLVIVLKNRNRIKLK